MVVLLVDDVQCNCHTGSHSCLWFTATVLLNSIEVLSGPGQLVRRSVNWTLRDRASASPHRGGTS